MNQFFTKRKYTVSQKKKEEPGTRTPREGHKNFIRRRDHGVRVYSLPELSKQVATKAIAAKAAIVSYSRARHTLLGLALQAEMHITTVVVRINSTRLHGGCCIGLGCWRWILFDCFFVILISVAVGLAGWGITRHRWSRVRCEIQSMSKLRCKLANFADGSNSTVASSSIAYSLLCEGFTIYFG